MVTIIKNKGTRNAFVGVADAYIYIARIGLLAYHLVSTFELFKETGVVFREQTQVVNPVFEIGNALNAHTKSIAGVNVWVDSAGR
mgnify:FL=1